MRCTSCGTENRNEATSCPKCGASVGDRYAPPPSSMGADVATAYGVEPWELKRMRVSGLSWAALWLAVLVPPVGFLVSFFAISVANRFRKRPGNRAVAYAALGTALYMGFIVGVVAFTIWSETQRAEADAALYSLPAPYADPYAPGTGYDPAAPSPGTTPEEMAELQRLLEQLAQQPVPTE
jgi:hypothetical protein